MNTRLCENLHITSMLLLTFKKLTLLSRFSAPRVCTSRLFRLHLSSSFCFFVFPPPLSPFLKNFHKPARTKTLNLPCILFWVRLNFSMPYTSCGSHDQTKKKTKKKKHRACITGMKSYVRCVFARSRRDVFLPRRDLCRRLHLERLLWLSDARAWFFPSVSEIHGFILLFWSDEAREGHRAVRSGADVRIPAGIW